MDNKTNNSVCKVVVNHESQYSIWPADRPDPPGWRDTGQSGDKAKCLDYIKTAWTDMRPLSLREKMDGTGSSQRTG
jgi:MbtH protein